MVLTVRRQSTKNTKNHHHYVLRWLLAICALWTIIFGVRRLLPLIPYLPDADHGPNNLSALPTTATATSFSSSHSDSGPKKEKHDATHDDWFDASLWKSHPMTNSCFYVENICHSSSHWFYDNNNKNTGNQQKHQPFPLSLDLMSSDGPTVPLGYPLAVSVRNDIFNVSSPLQSDNATSQHPRCDYSPIPNHMTLFSLHNYMLGEFYTRSYMGLVDIMQNYHQSHLHRQHQGSDTGKDNDDGDSDARFWNQMMTQTQLYLHLLLPVRPSRPIRDPLSSHHLYLELLSSNPILPFLRLLDRNRCRCLKRLIFCGYRVKATSSQPPKQNGTDTTIATTTTTLQPSNQIGIIDERKRYPKQDKITDDRDTTNTNNTNTTYIPRYHSMHSLRQFLLTQALEQNPLLPAWVEARRRAIIHYRSESRLQRRQGYIEDNDFETKEGLKVIGLAQRTGRRRWVDLDALVSYCNTVLVKEYNNIVCVVINVEEERLDNPMQHIVAHHGVDVLMGIHGAQLTEALWMKPGSLVVEFLPWIPPSISWGQWTRWASRPTPLGVIFAGTNLDHIGYPLSVSSVLYDRDHSPANSTILCSDKRFERYRWNKEDFVIDIALFRDIVERFVVHRPTTCSDYLDRALDDYVLYNVDCIVTEEEHTKHGTETDTNRINETTGRRTAHQYYKNRGWETTKVTNCKTGNNTN